MPIPGDRDYYPDKRRKPGGSRAPTGSQTSSLGFGQPGHKDFGYGGHERGNEQADREHREAYGTPLRSAYSHIVGDVPVLSPDDRVGARAYLARIEEAIDKGGWTRNEWRRLYRLRTKWVKRAEGRDTRFKLFGNVRGGLLSEEKEQLKLVQQFDKIREELDEQSEA